MRTSNEFQFFWSEGPLNWVSQLCLRSFTRFSGVTVHLYSYDPDLNPDLSGCVCHDASEYLPREVHDRVKTSFGGTFGGAYGYTAAADLFRYKLLYEKGGWYFDTDCLLLKPLTPLFDRDYVFGLHTKTEVNNAVIKFPKGEAVLDQLYKESIQKVPDPDTWPSGIGPSLFTQYLKKFGLTDLALPRGYFYALSWWEQQQSSILDENPYILHLYASAKESFQSKIDPRIKSLERQIEALRRQIAVLNNSLSLRMARKIPLGKAIQKLLVNDEQSSS
jgi:glycosyl transferase-like sugar-binding protein